MEEYVVDDVVGWIAVDDAAAESHHQWTIVRQQVERGKGDAAAIVENAEPAATDADPGEFGRRAGVPHQQAVFDIEIDAVGLDVAARDRVAQRS